MKRIIQGSLAFLLSVSILGFTGYIETHYTLQGTMYYMGNNEYEIEDTNGNIWIWESDTDFESRFEFKPVHNVELEMFNHYTDNTIKDDEIVSVSIINQ